MKKFKVCTVHLIQSGRLRWADPVARMEKGRSAFKMLTDNPKGKILLGRARPN